MTGPVLAIDVGGTKLAAAVIDPDGEFLARGAVSTPDSSDPDKVTGALRELARGLVDRAPARMLVGLGIGSAGPVDPAAGTVSPVNIPAWRDFPLVETLREVLPGRPAVLAGDGQCMALGEYWRGDRSAGAMLGIVVSTGVGGGLVMGGRVHLGPTGNAGHIGHIVVDIHGDPCACGGRGCVETMASGPAIARWAAEQGRYTGDARALAKAAHRGDRMAQRAFDRAAVALAAGIVSTAALVDLDEVVVGGGVAGAGEALFAPLRDAVEDLAGLGFIRRVRVRPSPLGADAGLLGAAALALAAAGRGDPT
jgi:glucokinase